VLGAAWALFLAACGSTLMNQRVETKAKGWTLVLKKIKDGPDDYATGNGHFVPPSGKRFLSFAVTLRNDEGTARLFNYSRCDLDVGPDRALPVLVDKDMVINVLADEEETLKPREELPRVLIFSYPNDRLPTRLACGELLINLHWDKS